MGIPPAEFSRKLNFKKEPFMRKTLFWATFASCIALGNATSSQSFVSSTVDTVLKVENTSTSGNGVGISGKSSINSVGIGVSGYVNGTGAVVGVRGYNATSSTGYGVHGTSVAAGWGVFGLASAANGVGVEGRATNASGYYGVRGVGPSIGVYGITLGTTGEGVRGKSIDSVGVMALSTGGNAVRANTTDGYGVYATSTNSVGVGGTGGTYGVVGSSGSGTGIYGEGPTGIIGFSTSGGTAIGASSEGTGAQAFGGFAVGTNAIGIDVSGSGTGSLAAYFDGDVVITGSCSGCSVSDEKLKTNVRGLTGGLAKVLALRPKAYEMRTQEYAGKMNLAKGTQLGLIAQELEQVVPEVVHDVIAPARMTPEQSRKGVKLPPDHVKAVNYAALVPVLIAAIQEQQAQLDAQRAQIEALKAGR